MDWNTLLNPVRTRELQGGVKSRTGDFRNEFQRDYGRIVYSTPFRRLQDKAQVFPLESHDAVRTRLTHTNEVASISQGIAQRIAQLLFEHENSALRISFDQAKSIETIASACALLHDIGNPPFGHAGEESIAEWFSKKSDEDFWLGIMGRARNDPLSTDQLKNDFLRFEGNAQTIRLVSRLQLLNDLHGLNLTAGTISAALKYVAGSHQIDKNRHQFRKHGYFASEKPLVGMIREATGTGTNENPLRNPIAMIVEAADDLAYSTADIEDAIRKKFISWDQIRSGLELEAKHIDSASQRSESAEAIVKKLLDEAQSLIGEGSGFSLSPWEKAEANSIMLRTLIIGKGSTEVVENFGAKYSVVMETGLDSALLSLGIFGDVVDACKRFAAKEVYPKASQLEILGRKVIHDLMDFFWQEVKDCPEKLDELDPRLFRAKVIRTMSTNYRRIYEHERQRGVLPPRYVEFQLITDYVCGMTDTYACSLHRSIFNG